MSDIHAFQIGSFRCWIISDGVRSLVDRHGSTVINASDAELDEALANYAATSGDDPYISGTNILLIDTGQHRVLVDTGDGPVSEPGFGHLLERLELTGVRATDIDTVIITHGHGDHIGACADAQGEPTFPNARYVMTEVEWEFRTEKPSQGVRTNLLPLGERIELISPGTEIVPGIRSIPMPGHSPGQIGLMIESGGERLLHAVDGWHHPVQVSHPDWHFGYDADVEQATSTRRDILKLAASNNLLVLSFHAAFPGLGHVIQTGETWRWQPVGIG